MQGEVAAMKRKIFFIFMVIFTGYISSILFISFVCGAPMGCREELNRYLFGAVGLSILLPAGFSFFFINTLSLSRRLEEIEKSLGDKEHRDLSAIHRMLEEFGNTLVKKKKLTSEEKERLLSYIEEL